MQILAVKSRKFGGKGRRFSRQRQVIFQWENILKLAPEGWLSCVEKSARKSQKFAPKKGFEKVVNLTTCVKISAKKINFSGQTGSIEHSRTITSLSG